MHANNNSNTNVNCCYWDYSLPVLQLTKTQDDGVKSELRVSLFELDPTASIGKPRGPRVVLRGE